MSANKIANTQSRAVRTISILLLTILAFTGIAFAVGATSFKLGLDLQGGTSVTLQPRIEAGQVGKVTTEAIDQAVGIIRQRVNSLGVAESEVFAQGSGVNRQIVISVPGETGRRIVDLVGQTAELRFRPVLAVGAANATTTSLSLIHI
jgi:preprotein translocase subunit SecD